MHRTRRAVVLPDSEDEEEVPVAPSLPSPRIQREVVPEAVPAQIPKEIEIFVEPEASKDLETSEASEPVYKPRKSWRKAVVLKDDDNSEEFEDSPILDDSEAKLEDSVHQENPETEELQESGLESEESPSENSENEEESEEPKKSIDKNPFNKLFDGLRKAKKDLLMKKNNLKERRKKYKERKVQNYEESDNLKIWNPKESEIVLFRNSVDSRSSTPISEHSEHSKDSENEEMDELEDDKPSKLKKPAKKLKKLKKLTKTQRHRIGFKYAMKVMLLQKLEDQVQTEIRVKKSYQERKEESMRKFTNRSWVQQPTRKIHTEALTRPYIEPLYYDDKKEHGSARELMNDMFGYLKDDYKPWYTWRLDNPRATIDDRSAAETLRTQNLYAKSATVTPEDIKRRRENAEKKKTLECLQEIIRLLHFKKHDERVQSAVNLIKKRSTMYANGEEGFTMIRDTDYSMTWSDYWDDEKLVIMEQRDEGCMLRPVFVNGHSILSNFFPNIGFDFPKLPIKILINFLMHFILEGHQICIYLPDYYQCYQSSDIVDDPIAFEFLVAQKLIKFSDSTEKVVLEEAEKTHGILVTSSVEDVEVQNSVICRPLINHFLTTGRIDDFLLMFDWDSGDSENVEKDYCGIEDSKGVENALYDNEDPGESEDVDNSKDVKVSGGFRASEDVKKSLDDVEDSQKLVKDSEDVKVEPEYVGKSFEDSKDSEKDDKEISNDLKRSGDVEKVPEDVETSGESENVENSEAVKVSGGFGASEDVKKESEHVGNDSEVKTSSEGVQEPLDDMEDSQDLVKDSEDVEKVIDENKEPRESEDVENSKVVRVSGGFGASEGVKKESKHVVQGSEAQTSSEGVQKPQDDLEDSQDLVEDSEDVIEDSEHDGKGFEAPEDPERSDYYSDSEFAESIDKFVAFSRKCRLYSQNDLEDLDTHSYQLSITDQVFLIASLCHLTGFHSRPFRLIKAFFVTINTLAPHLIPKFMQKTLIYDIADALESIRIDRTPDVWPLFTKL